MKVLILACLVALALAREKEQISVPTETLESVSTSEETTTHINKQKLEKVKHEEQLQREEKLQEKILPFIQSQPLLYPYAEPIPVLPQNTLNLVQPDMLLPLLQPEIMEDPKVKETTFPKRKVMPFLKSPMAFPFVDPQLLNLRELKTQHPFLPELLPFMHQLFQPFFQTPMLYPQAQLPVSQTKFVPIPQQMVPYTQRDMPVQALQLFQDLRFPTHGFYPVTQPLAPVNV
ncbi:beta-casein isoform X1 [Ochotona curzoniae]|uniref:beta-casein isoform X1 n=1 Tax=Ochotona curzoniae TaxID=130825 RepID=UPI001B345F4A|nr:beta-casein isoform X1 [Ochotona curzoniae]